MHRPTLAACAMIASALPSAAGADTSAPRIVVTGTASVTVAPDVAIIDYDLRGEGSTSDGAVAALVASKKAVDGGIAAETGAVPTGGAIDVQPRRTGACTPFGVVPPNAQPHPCVITGYQAELSQQIRTDKIARAGTIAGLVSRLGGGGARVSSYQLADSRAAERRAMAAAIADAKARAQSIADGAGVRLGSILIATDGSGDDSAMEVAVPMPIVAAPPPIVAAAPIEVTVKPEPIEISARVTVSYQIVP